LSSNLVEFKWICVNRLSLEKRKGKEKKEESSLKLLAQPTPSLPSLFSLSDPPLSPPAWATVAQFPSPLSPRLPPLFPRVDRARPTSSLGPARTHASSPRPLAVARSAQPVRCLFSPPFFLWPGGPRTSAPFPLPLSSFPGATVSSRFLRRALPRARSPGRCVAALQSPPCQTRGYRAGRVA
jgi:hypothetical protein